MGFGDAISGSGACDRSYWVDELDEITGPDEVRGIRCVRIAGLGLGMAIIEAGKLGDGDKRAFW